MNTAVTRIRKELCEIASADDVGYCKLNAKLYVFCVFRQKMLESQLFQMKKIYSKLMPVLVVHLILHMKPEYLI